jgi:lipid A 3-O-deacylase
MRRLVRALLGLSAVAGLIATGEPARGESLGGAAQAPSLAPAAPANPRHTPVPGHGAYWFQTPPPGARDLFYPTPSLYALAAPPPAPAPVPAPYPPPAPLPEFAPPPYPPPVAAQPLPAPAAVPPKAVAAAPPPVPPEAVAAAAEEEEAGAFGVLSDVRLGLLAHDAGIFGRKEEEGLDVNLELVFVSPGLLRFLWSPKPHLGFTVNTQGDTSQVYAGLTWEWWFWRRFFFNFAFGFSVHDGETETDKLDAKELGSRVLFREAIDLGWNFWGPHSLSFFLDHVSHGGLLGDKNEGLDTIGARYIYRF